MRTTDLTSHAVPNVRDFVEIFTLETHAVPLKVPRQCQLGVRQVGRLCELNNRSALTLSYMVKYLESGESLVETNQ